MIRELPLVTTLALFAALAGCKEECTPRCSDDGYVLYGCADGAPVTISCMRDEGRVCEDGACVDPWRFGAPAFGTCPSDPHATVESLAEKASYYDDIALRLHVHPELGFALNVVLRGREVACGAGESPPCFDPSEPAVPERDATLADVERFASGENDGLWSALYLTSQAYRYAVTGSSEALETIRLLLAAEERRMRITGVPGIFTRQLIPPGIDGVACPTEDREYTTDAEKDDNRWVQVRDDGCVWVVDRETSAWTKSDHCGLEAYAGSCWLDNVSKDEYSGHMLALVAVFRLVDVPEVRSSAARMLEQVADHLVQNNLTLVDWDGRVTEHGRFSPIALDDFPGFNAAMALAYVGAGAAASGREDLREFYRRCLLQRDGGAECLGFADPEPFTAFLSAPGMYVGSEGCGSNYNNISMHLLTLHTLLWIERDPPVRELVQASLDTDVMRKEGEPRVIIGQKNALFDFIWAAGKRLGPGDEEGPAFAAVEDGICQLRQFRASQSVPTIVVDPVRHAPYCKNRFDRDVSRYPRETWERCPSTFVWWGDPYSLSECTENRRDIRQPSGYLLPYWMGRYYGFIGPEL